MAWCYSWASSIGSFSTTEIGEALDLPGAQQGVLIVLVEVNSPADEAGLRGGYKSITIDEQALSLGGDIITAVDGKPITGLEDLQAFIQRAKPGQKVILTRVRDGKEIEQKVTLGERPVGGL